MILSLSVFPNGVSRHIHLLSYSGQQAIWSAAVLRCTETGHLPLTWGVNFFGVKTGAKSAMAPILAPIKTVAALRKSRSVTYNLAPGPDLRHTLEFSCNVPINRTFVGKLPQKKAGVARLRTLDRRLGAGPLTCFIFDPRKYPFKSSEISVPAAFSKKHNGEYPLLGYLLSIKRKLDAALHAYTMVNLTGFSESSETHYYQIRKAAYICHSQPKESAIAEICAQLNVTEKKAVQLLEQVQAIDTFRWYGGVETEDGQDDIPVGVDLLGYCRKPQPEAALIRKETMTMLHRAFRKLDYKEQDIVSRYLGFYKACFRPLFSNTFEELADLYQYTTADGVMRFYHRTLDKLRLLLDRAGMFRTVRLKRRKKNARKLIYAYIPSDEGEPGTIEFLITDGVVGPDYSITGAEKDYPDLRLGHASARLLLKLAQQDALPADRVLPLRNVHIGA